MRRAIRLTVVGWPHRSGGRGVAGEVGHHLLTLDAVDRTADAVGLGQCLHRGWAAVFT
jgi:hypothetical protein